MTGWMEGCIHGGLCTYSLFTSAWLTPKAHTHPVAPFNCSSMLSSNLEKSLQRIVLILESLVPWIIGTGRRLRIEILLISGFLVMAWRTAEPTRPVAPVSITCIVVQRKENIKTIRSMIMKNGRRDLINDMNSTAMDSADAAMELTRAPKLSLKSGAKSFTLSRLMTIHYNKTM